MKLQEVEPTLIAVHELGIVEFIVATKQARYREQLSTPKDREKFLENLAHFHDWDPARSLQIPAHEQSADAIAKRLHGMGATETCHVVSTLPDLDRSSGHLDDLLTHVVGSGEPTVISCIPGKLAYFEDEDRNQRFILSVADARQAR